MMLFLLILFEMLSCAAWAASPAPCCKQTVRIEPRSEISDICEEGQNFNAQMLYLLDQREGNYLYRGNMPQMNGSFAYADLTQALAAILQKEGITLSSSYLLFDLSFLNYKHEKEEIDLEINWFSQNAAKGCFWLNSLQGCLFNPLDFPQDLREFLCRHHDPDGLKSLMSELKKLLDGTCHNDFVIYMHCNEGKDRTGEAAACYLMQYKGYSYEAAKTLDFTIAERAVHDKEMNAIRWYAFYLRDIEKIPTIGSIEGK